MADRHIIAVGPASGRGEHVVIEVLQDGTHSLDLRLVGCEGENPYVTTIKQRNIGKLKHKFKGSEDDWVAVVSHFLLQQPVSKPSLIEGVRLVYTLKGDLQLSFRQDVQGIKVTLGEISLPRDDDFEFNPFEWAQASAQAHAATLQELAQLKSTASSEVDTIAKLNAQLDDFIKAKNESETAMLQQFMELLNEKKRKIRDQSRLLAGAKVDRTVATTVQASRSAPRKAAGSRKSKRKAPAQAAEPDEEQPSDSDQMEINQAKDDEQEGEVVTPEPSDAETDEEEAAAAESSQTVAAKEEEKSDPPPPRQLPFNRRNKHPEPLPAADDADDATEDEEL